MVQDIRHIILSFEEVILSFESYLRMNPDFMPKGTVITDCRSANGAIIVNTKLPIGGGEQLTEFRFSEIDILKPIIRFCIENNIMLPRNGKKTIVIEEKRVIMRVELDLYTDLPYNLGAMQISDMNKNNIPLEGLVAPV